MKTVYEIVQEYKNREYIREYRKMLDSESMETFTNLSIGYKKLADVLREINDDRY